MPFHKTPGSGLGGHVDGLAIGKTHIGLALALAAASAETEGLDLAYRVDEVHLFDLDVKQTFHGSTDIGLGCRRGNDEYVLVMLGESRRFLGNVRRAQRVENAFVVHAHASHSSTFFTASTVITTWSEPTSLTGFSAITSSTWIYGMLRAARNTDSEASSDTSNTRPETSSSASLATIAEVFGVSMPKLSTH